MDNNLQKYQAFVKTVETGSFTHAARLLNYAQSSVSKMIADLEKEWGVTLLERSRSGVYRLFAFLLLTQNRSGQNARSGFAVLCVNDPRPLL